MSSAEATSDSSYGVLDAMCNAKLLMRRFRQCFLWEYGASFAIDSLKTEQTLHQHKMENPKMLNMASLITLILFQVQKRGLEIIFMSVSALVDSMELYMKHSLTGENAVIYKDFEGALSPKNESHSSI